MKIISKIIYWWLILVIVLMPAFIYAKETLNSDNRQCEDSILFADFNNDNVNLPPDTSLPDPPDGDYLVLDTAYGTILVQSNVGSLTDQPVDLSHEMAVGQVILYAYPITYENCDSINVAWRSLVRMESYQTSRCELRSSTNKLIASIDYRGSGELTYGSPNDVLPVDYSVDVDQLFEISIDFISQTTSLSIDGSPVTGYQNFPFGETATEFGVINFVAEGSHLILDDISACLNCIEPLPDLQILSFELSGSESVYWGEQISSRLSLMVENIGAASNEACQVGFYLSEDSVITVDDIPLINGLAAVPAMQPQEQAEINVSLDMGIPSGFATGWAYLGVIVDDLELIIESDELNNSRHIPVEVTDCYEKVFLIQDAAGYPIPSKTFKIYKVFNDPPDMTEFYLGDGTTDGTGRMNLCRSPGDTIKIKRKVMEQEAIKHPDFSPITLYKIYVDNALFDEVSGAILYDEFNTDPEQTVQLNHGLITVDLAISVEWDATLDYLNDLVDGLRLSSNFLYDVSDGQVHLDQIYIYDNRLNWSRSDMRVNATNMLRPCASPRGWDCSYLMGGVCDGAIRVPPKWFGNPDRTRIMTANEIPLDMEDSRDFKTKIHELGHFFFGFFDEYVDGDGDGVSHSPVHGFMEFQYDGGGARGSEMSRTSVEYASPAGQNTAQWAYFGQGCDEMFKYAYDGIYDNIQVILTFPGDYGIEGYLVGPNNDLSGLNNDVGALMDAYITDFDGATTVPRLQARYDGEFLDNVPVAIDKSGGVWARWYSLGRTDDWGHIKLLGYVEGDYVTADAHHIIDIKDKNGVAKQVKRWFTEAGPPIDSAGILLLELLPIDGDWPYTQAVSWAGNGPEFSLFVLNHPFSAPTLEIVPDDSGFTAETFPLILDGMRYYGVFTAEMLGSSGRFIVQAMDSSSNVYPIRNQYNIHELNSSPPAFLISGPEGSCQLLVDPQNGNDRSLVIMASHYPPVLNGIRSEVIQAGLTVSLTFLDEMPLFGSNVLIIHYAESDLGEMGETNESELNLKIFKWGDSQLTWEQMGGAVDTAHNTVSVEINDVGVYAAFLTNLSDCVPGNANGDALINIFDITYLISYLYKDGPAPTPYPICSGDPNGIGCTCNIFDVTYLISFLYKSGPDPVTCEDWLAICGPPIR